MSVDNNYFAGSWKKELDCKNFDELLNIIAFADQYNPEFVKMAKEKLESHSDYDPNKVIAMVEEKKKETQPPVKDPANTILKVANIGCIIMKVIFIILAIPVVLFLSFSNSTADNKVGALIIYVCLYGIYKFAKKKWKQKKGEFTP